MELTRFEQMIRFNPIKEVKAYFPELHSDKIGRVEAQETIYISFITPEKERQGYAPTLKWSTDQLRAEELGMVSRFAKGFIGQTMSGTGIIGRVLKNCGQTVGVDVSFTPYITSINYPDVRSNIFFFSDRYDVKLESLFAFWLIEGGFGVDEFEHPQNNNLGFLFEVPRHNDRALTYSVTFDSRSMRVEEIDKQYAKKPVTRESMLMAYRSTKTIPELMDEPMFDIRPGYWYPKELSEPAKWKRLWKTNFRDKSFYEEAPLGENPFHITYERSK
jgi:hypothetical protein